MEFMLFFLSSQKCQVLITGVLTHSCYLVGAKVGAWHQRVTLFVKQRLVDRTETTVLPFACFIRVLVLLYTKLS